LPHSEDDDLNVVQRLAACDASEFILLNPGGGWLAKRWAPENYSELLRRLEPRLHCKVLLTGSAEEEKVISGILARAETRRACYFPSTLVQFIALARRAKLFVGGDTGPLHLAAAVGTPIVAIYGPTDPLRNGPFSPVDIALSNRGPIDHTRRGSDPSYLPGVSVESVLKAIEERLARADG
jgi:heptosyltransferase I